MIAGLIASRQRCWRMHELRKHTGLSRVELQKQLVAGMKKGKVSQQLLTTGETVYFARVQG
ncbi:hypothetical protein [Plesiomonas shigelloides]|uniref:hypothetical protein n=1 Tax=Plesiomonas shigelloides TaxID=703 RepID=UPI00387F1664